ARLDQQRPLQRAPVDVGRLARDAVADLRAADPKRPVTVDADGPAVVTGDEERLRQVIGNLLSNARVDTPPGTAIDVTVGSANGAVTVSVADRGPGLPLQERDKVFERFYRADSSRSRDTGGSGLGLA